MTKVSKIIKAGPLREEMVSSGVQIKNSTTELQNSIGVENISEPIVVIQSIVTTAGSKLISGLFLT